MTTGRTSRRRLAAAGLGAVLVGVACVEERATLSEPLATRAFTKSLSRDGRNFPGGTAEYSRPTGAGVTGDSAITLTLTGLDSLVGDARYTVWLADTTAAGQVTNYTAAVGALTVIRTDTTFSPEGDPIPNPVTTSLGNTNTFSNGGPATTVRLRISRTTLGSNPFLRHLVLVNVTRNAGLADSSITKVLWARRRELGAGVAVGTGANARAVFTAPVRFGNFHAKPDSQYVFAVSGRGTATVFGNLFQNIDSALARPPHGYVYEVHLVTRDSLTNAIVDTVSAGPLRSPIPRLVPLLRADSASEDAVVLERPYAIAAGIVRVRADTLPQTLRLTPAFKTFAETWVTLEHKAGRPDVAAPTIILSATFPDVIRFGPE